MTAVTAVLLRLLTFTLLLVTSAQPSHPQPDGCSAVLVASSPCLPYVSAPPNDMAQTMPPQCCDAIKLAFDSGHGDCLCEPLRQPFIFGFPLNKTRLLSLSSVCHTSGSLESICSTGSSPTLPPLRGGTTGSEIPKPPDSDKLPQLPPLPIPKPPGSREQPHLPIPKPSDPGKQLQLPLPPLPFPKPSDSSKQPQLPSAKPSDSGNLRPLTLPPLGGTTSPDIPKPFDPVNVNASAPSQSLTPDSATSSPTTLSLPPAQAVTSPSTPSSSSSAQVSGASFPTKQISNSSSWFLPGILISLLVFIHI